MQLGVETVIILRGVKLKISLVVRSISKLEILIFRVFLISLNAYLQQGKKL